MSGPHSKPKIELKVVVVGDSFVGKTSVLNQYVNMRFSSGYIATIGVDFLVRNAVVDGRHVTLQIWDTAGQERFRSLGNAYYRGADACVLVYSVVDAQSFRSLECWRDEFLVLANVRDPETFPFVLLGNKIDDVTNRVVAAEKAQRWCTSANDTPYFEVSAKTAINVDEAFQTLAKAALQRHDQQALLGPPELPPPIRIESSDGANRGGKGRSWWCKC